MLSGTDDPIELASPPPGSVVNNSQGRNGIHCALMHTECASRNLADTLHSSSNVGSPIVRSASRTMCSYDLLTYYCSQSTCYVSIGATAGVL